MYRVVLERRVMEFHLIEASSEEQAITMAMEGLLIEPDSTEDVDVVLVDVEEME
jgi:hypothetical protein